MEASKPLAAPEKLGPRATGVVFVRRARTIAESAVRGSPERHNFFGWRLGSRSTVAVAFPTRARPAATARGMFAASG